MSSPLPMTVSLRGEKEITNPPEVTLCQKAHPGKTVGFILMFQDPRKVGQIQKEWLCSESLALHLELEV